MKSKLSPNVNLFQLVVQDFKNRKPAPNKDYYVDKSGKGIKEVVDHIPLRTLFRHAKNNRQAIKSASKVGTVISCRKVDSHFHRLHMIEHLRIEMKPIEVNISADEFVLGKDLEVSPKIDKKIIDVENT